MACVAPAVRLHLQLLLKVLGDLGDFDALGVELWKELILGEYGECSYNHEVSAPILPFKPFFGPFIDSYDLIDNDQE